MESARSQRACQGIACSRMPQMPVPMVTENQEGVKLRTMRRQPTSYFVFRGDSGGGAGSRQSSSSILGLLAFGQGHVVDVDVGMALIRRWTVHGSVSMSM
jgi:hypothetical protein